MKYIIVVTLLLFSIISVWAQKHTVYGDVGYSLGGSLTYNYKIAKQFGVGIGLQGYKYYRDFTKEQKFTPSVFADIRFSIRAEKNNQFLSFIDLGMNLYKQDKSYYRYKTTIQNIPHNNGFYFGLGFGYMRRITKRGGGPYASIKVITNWYNFNSYSYISEDKDTKPTHLYLSPVISLGFKW